MLLGGINHVAVLTGDTDRFTEFYGGVFDATHEVLQERDGFKLTMVEVGATAELNVFELAGNTESQRQVPTFGRGRLDHLALQAASLEAFDEIRDRLLARGATDGFVTDFGHILSLFFRDPTGWRPRSAWSTLTLGQASTTPRARRRCDITTKTRRLRIVLTAVHCAADQRWPLRPAQIARPCSMRQATPTQIGAGSSVRRWRSCPPG